MELALECETPECHERIPDGRIADSADPFQRIVEVDVDFTACERSGVVEQVPQAAFDRPSMLRFDEEVVGLSSQLRRKCRDDTQQRFGVLGIGHCANRAVSYSSRSCCIHGNAFDGSYDSGCLQADITDETQNLIQSLIRRIYGFEQPFDYHDSAVAESRNADGMCVSGPFPQATPPPAVRRRQLAARSA